MTFGIGEILIQMFFVTIEEYAIVHILTVAPTDQYPVHCIFGPVLGGDAGFFQDSDILHGAHRQFVQMFLFFCLRSSIFPAEEQKRTFFLLGVVLPKFHRKVYGFLQTTGSVPIHDKRSSLFIILGTNGKGAEDTDLSTA